MKLIFVVLLTLSPLCMAQDASVEWLLNQSATAPSTNATTHPSTKPTSPLDRIVSDPASRSGKITLSDGSVHTGRVTTTQDKPLRFYDTAIKEYRDVPLTMISKLEAKVLWERDEPEWHFKESGSDIKEFTGKTYPARELEYDVKLINGQTFTGGVVAPLYVESKGKQRQHVLYKRTKGAVGKTLSELVYVAKVELTK